MLVVNTQEFQAIVKINKFFKTEKTKLLSITYPN